MSDVAYQTQAGRFAAGLLLQAAGPVAIAAAMLVAAPFLPDGSLDAHVAVQLVAIAAGIVTTALSALAVFDALLFRLMASYPDETAGGAAVDDVLARMRLKPAPTRIRTLAERTAGARRILAWQRAAVSVSAGAYTILIAGG